MSWLPKRCVVVPYDFSTKAKGAVETALSMVENAGQVHVIHVLPELQVNEPGVVWDTIDDESRMQHALEAIREKLADPALQGIDIVASIGDPGYEIADFAKGLGAELIVLPSHGRKGLSRILLGSVAERVVRLSHCPVLVLRGG